MLLDQLWNVCGVEWTAQSYAPSLQFFSASPSSTQRARFKATVAQSTQQELAGAILLMGQPVRYTLHGLKFQVYFAWVDMSGILCMGNLSGIFTSGSTFQVYFSHGHWPLVVPSFRTWPPPPGSQPTLGPMRRVQPLHLVPMNVQTTLSPLPWWVDNNFRASFVAL